MLRDSNPVELMNLACKNALLRRDVAHLIFPDEVQTLPAPEGAAAGGPDGRVHAARRSRRPRSRSTTRCGCCAARKRPVIIVGHGARFHMPAVIALAEQLGAPVITTFKAKGQIGDDHPLAAGVLGRSGTPVASWVMNEADLLLVLGASFSNHTGIYAGHPIIQVDFDPMQLGKFHPVEVPVWGEVGVVVDRAARRAARPARRPTTRRAQLAERWAIWRAEKASRAADDRGAGVNSASVFAAMERQIPDDAVIAVDVGNHAYSFGRYFECKRHTVLMSGYLGSIGFGYPAAMGAWAAAPDRPIVAVTGDGGFAQYMAELTTAVKHGMNITHVLLNNGQLGKISKEQRAGEWEVWQTSLHNPDFSAFARNCGALGIRVTDRARARRRPRRGRRPRRPGDGRGHHRPRPRLTGARMTDTHRQAGRAVRAQHHRLLGPEGVLHQLHAQARPRALPHAGADGHLDGDHAPQRRRRSTASARSTTRSPPASGRT